MTGPPIHSKPALSGLHVRDQFFMHDVGQLVGGLLLQRLSALMMGRRIQHHRRWLLDQTVSLAQVLHGQDGFAVTRSRTAGRVRARATDFHGHLDGRPAAFVLLLADHTGGTEPRMSSGVVEDR